MDIQVAPAVSAQAASPFQLAIPPVELWAGTQHSLAVAIEAMMHGMQAYAGRDSDDQDDEPPYNYQLHGEIGVISISGPLVNNDRWYNRYIGVTSYADIRRALIYAANDSGAANILLDIDSGGGSVSGVEDTGNLITRIDKGVKPVYAFSGGTMASAAYWLGSSAREVHNSATALLGSIGVIMTHMEYSKMFKEAGIGVTVLRAGEYKALLNSHEPADERAKAQAQETLDAAYAVFRGHVAERRGVSPAVFDQKMGQGREFFGEKAAAIGLSDSVTSFDALVSKLTQKVLDERASSNHNSVNFHRGLPMGKQALTDQNIAAMAAGATLGAVTETEEGKDSKSTTDSETAATTGTTETTTTAETKPADETKAPSAETLAFMQGQLNAANEKVVDLTVELRETTAKVTSMTATHSALLQIAAQSLSNMRIALGGSAVDATSMSAEALLAEHGKALEQFKSKFKAGGVASASSEPSAKSSEVDPLHLQRVRATSLK